MYNALCELLTQQTYHKQNMTTTEKTQTSI